MKVFMPFGKYKDRPLSAIPVSYLQWLLHEARPKPWLADAVRRELASRDDDGDFEEDEYPDRPESTAVMTWKPLVKSWFARLALKYHPDRGGDLKAMQALNDAHELLVEMLEGGQ